MTAKTAEYIPPEWSVPVNEEDITATPAQMSLEAPPESLRALAQRFDVLSVEGIRADAVLVREAGGAIVHVSGNFTAQITQSCVVSGQPVPCTIEETFEGWFSSPDVTSLAKARHEKTMEKAGREMPILEERDDPEPIVDGRIDVGELVAQHVLLAIDPYPHAPGVHYELGDDAPPVPEADERKNPFAKLKDWKAEQENK